jgi:hypothetical protein
MRLLVGVGLIAVFLQVFVTFGAGHIFVDHFGDELREAGFWTPTQFFPGAAGIP